MGGRKDGGLSITVDPGKDTGIAVWKRGILDWAGLARGTWHEAARVATEKLRTRYDEELLNDAEMLFEAPQFYGTGGKKENDLVGLLLLSGALAGYLNLEPGSVSFVHVRDWKGQVPKNVMVNRIKKKLSRAEIARIDTVAKTLQHNIYDAVGIGLHLHDRLRR